MRSVLSLIVVGTLVVGGATACGDDEGARESAGSEDDRPRVVVTTNILGDIVAEVLGDAADVEVIMPLGADPHEFAVSARQAEAMEQADLLVVNGAGFEDGMVDIIGSAEAAGAPVFAFADHVDLIELTGENADDDEHAKGEDPHIWTDPSRIAQAVAVFANRAAELDGVDAAAVESQASEYIEELEALDAETENALVGVSAERRVLVTNHEVFGYFADRYDFDVIGAVIPSITTSAAASAADVEALADTIRERGVRAIFGETTQPTALADAIADEVGGDVEVIELFTESLGADGSGAETYVEMMRFNAERIAEALS